MSHHQPQESTERGNHSHRGIMDLRNLCQRLDVDSLKAKLPTLPQLKLPKSLPKLRGARRIFRSSRENVNNAGGKSGPGTGSGQGSAGVDSLAVPSSAQFINRTPQRISTISSLMHETNNEHQQQNHPGMLSATYCSAGSLDDDYYAPYGGGNNTAARASRPISPVKMPPNGTEAPQQQQQQQQQRQSLTQRLQRGYKSLSELRLKHLFAKQTTVRRDNIEVQHYVAQYEADRRVEQKLQARRDREIADNYDIHIKTLPITRENTLKERGEDEDEEQEEEEGIVEQVQRRKHAEPSGDESGLETPPAVATAAVAGKNRKKPGIAATRFSKVRQPPLQMPVEDQEQQDQAEPVEKREVMRQAMRQNLKRLRKSIKRVHQPRQQQQQQQNPTDDTDDEAEKEKDPHPKLRTSTLRARLRRFTSSEQLQQRWRKSFKTDNPRVESDAGVGAGAGVGIGVAAGLTAGVGAQLERTMAKLNEKMQNLKFFQRSEKSGQQQLGNKPNTVGREPNEIDDEELAATYHHSDSSSDDDDDDSGELPFDQEEDDDHLQKKQSPVLVKHQTMAKLAQLQAHASTAWSSESLEEDGGTMDQQQLASTASDYPRVLIHQQHTDAYESTLIIAVTTTPPSPAPGTVRSAGAVGPVEPAGPAAPLQSRSPLTQWVPNEKIIAGFKEQVGPWPTPSLYKPKSIDIFESDGGAAGAFADFDEALRNAPVLRISADSSCDSTEDVEDDSSSRMTRIRVQTARIGNSCESLMEQQPLDEDDEDDDDEEDDDVEEDEQQPLAEQEEEEEEEEPESERPPSESPPPPPLPQRRPPPPAVMAPIYDAVPPPLPISKPPAVLKSPAITSMSPAADAKSAVLPATTVASAVTTVTVPAATLKSPVTISKSPVTISKSPVIISKSPVTSPVAPLARLPQRSASMTRPGKPLVKTSSLRLTYNEQMHPGDFGKVNKLISRFEGRPRLCARRLHSEELTICSDEETEELPPTPTPANVNRSKDNNNIIPDIITTQPVNNNNNNNEENNINPSENSIQLSLDRQNSNCSRSEYGSPLSYPLSTNRQRRSSTPTMIMTTTTTTTTGSGRSLGLAPQSQTQQQQQQSQQQREQRARRSRRSMTRDDDNFYSFDSDEENSYYSISPSSSSRYVVEI